MLSVARVASSLKYLASRQVLTGVAPPRGGSGVQVVAMSACLGNLEALARWLDAELYRCTERPVPLRQLFKVSTLPYATTRLSDVAPLRWCSRASLVSVQCPNLVGAVVA